ncbi:TIGR03085 family metal-binding protein [Kineosporia sp. A_224]|uniref:TIGR03085 family metal-binding protein n=1 Tax=Kineosporia sp. A_224 TaxID=1962180 RepID=UPI000B4B61EA|nr:TIGR03085 family metal-binding protein [Kineosporia sp. A_224]
MQAVLWDDVERAGLCDDLERLGPDAPTLLAGWTASDLAAHLVQREHDPLAAPTLVLPVRYQRFADGRRDALRRRHGFERLVEMVRTGPPPGVFRVPWVRATANLNELFVHYEDVRRANGFGPRADLPPGLDDALWRNVRVGGRYLTRRLRGTGLRACRAATEATVALRRGDPTVAVIGPPGELLLFLFGRVDARVDLLGAPDAVEAVRATHLGM